MSFKYLTKFPVNSQLYDSHLPSSISCLVGLSRPASRSKPRNISPLNGSDLTRPFGVLQRHQSPIKPNRNYALFAKNKQVKVKEKNNNKKCPVPIKCDAIEGKDGCFSYICAPYDFNKNKKKEASCKPEKKDSAVTTAECKMSCAKMGLHCCCTIKYKPEDLVKIHRCGKSIKAKGCLSWDEPECKKEEKKCKKPIKCDKPMPPPQIAPEPGCEEFILDPDACDSKKATNKASIPTRKSKEKSFARLFSKDASANTCKDKNTQSDKCRIKIPKRKVEATKFKSSKTSLLPKKSAIAMKPVKMVKSKTALPPKQTASSESALLSKMKFLLPIKETKVWKDDINSACSPKNMPKSLGNRPNIDMKMGSKQGGTGKKADKFAVTKTERIISKECDITQFQFDTSEKSVSPGQAESRCIEVNIPLIKEYLTKVKKNVCPKVCKSVLDKKWSELGLTKEGLAKSLTPKPSTLTKGKDDKPVVKAKASAALTKVKDAKAVKLDPNKLSVKPVEKVVSTKEVVKPKPIEKPAKSKSWGSLLKSIPAPKETAKEVPKLKPAAVKEVAAKTTAAAAAVPKKELDPKTDLEKFCDQINSVQNKIDSCKDAVVDVDCLIDDKTDQCSARCKARYSTEEKTDCCPTKADSCENAETVCKDDCAEKIDCCEDKRDACKDKADTCEDECEDKLDACENKKDMCEEKVNCCEVQNECKNVCEDEKDVCKDPCDAKDKCKKENACASEDPCSTRSDRINKDTCKEEVCVFKGKEDDCEDSTDKCKEPPKCSSNEVKCKDSDNESKKGPPKSGGSGAGGESSGYSCPPSSKQPPQVLFKACNLEAPKLNRRFQVEALLIPHSLEVYSILRKSILPKQIVPRSKSITDNIRRYSRKTDSVEQFLPQMDRVAVRFPEKVDAPFYYRILQSLKEFFGFHAKPNVDLSLVGSPASVPPAQKSFEENMSSSMVLCKKCCELPKEDPPTEDKPYDRCNRCEKYDKPKKKKKTDCCPTTFGVDTWLESRIPSKKTTDTTRCGCYELCWDPHKGKCGMEECPRCRRYAVYEDPVVKPKPSKCAEMKPMPKMAPRNCCKPRKMNRPKPCEYIKKLEEGTCQVKKKKQPEIEKSPCGGPCLKSKCVIEKKKAPCDPRKPFCQEKPPSTLMKPSAEDDEKSRCKSTVKVSSARPFNSSRECEPLRVVEIPPEEPVIEVKGCQRSNQCQVAGFENPCGSPSNLPFPRLDGKLPKPSDQCKKGFMDECKCFCDTVMNVFAPPGAKDSSKGQYYMTGKVDRENAKVKNTGPTCKQSICRRNVEKNMHYLEPAPMQIAKPLKPERYLGRKCKKDTEILRGRITKGPVRRNYLETMNFQKKPLGRTFPNDYAKAFETKYQCKRIPAYGDKCGIKHKKMGAGYLRPLEKKPGDTRNAACGCARSILCKKKRS